MRRNALPLTVLALSALCACQPASRGGGNAVEDTTIEVERSGGGADSPVYRLRIDGNGIAMFSAPDASGRHPLRHSNGEVMAMHPLDEAQHVALVGLLNSQAFAALAPRYEAGSKNGAVTTITVAGRAGKRRVTQYAVACLRDSKRPGAVPSNAVGPGSGFVPDVFCEAVDLIENASCAGYWSAQTRPPREPSDPRLSPPERCRLPTQGTPGGAPPML
ncbi:hypothetical protein [Lysobacter firmicutimachus]|uniref:Lipoprotein n=1 Tax=Lysobacter firmicutimachus TaxID=1792846 RepID=A0ABU8D360_9GAMM